MMEVLFLGTGCMQPTKARNHSGILLSHDKENILFDCGEGIQRQMRIAGVKPAKITRICISHWHGDHVFGLPGLLSTMGADKPEKKIYIYGPPGTKEYMKHLLLSFAAKDIIEHEIIEIKDGKFFENDDFILESRHLKHSVLCYGFSLIEKDKRKINIAKAEKLGISGPNLGKLQDGESITIKGKSIHPDEVSTVTKGKKVSYIADTTLCDGAYALAKDCTVLISEGTHLDEIKEKTEKYMHLTVKEAALLASESNVEKLVVTHISQRYKESGAVLEEAKNYFHNVVVAEDFMKFKI